MVDRIRGIRANEPENDFTVTIDGGSVTYNSADSQKLSADIFVRKDCSADADFAHMFSY